MDITSPSSGRKRARQRRPLGVMDFVWFLPRLVSRIFFPKLADRYAIGELLGPLLFGWTLFILLYVCSVNLFKLAKLYAAGARPEAVMELLGLQVVLSTVYCLPMAMLLAGLMAFGRLSGDSELIAMQAGGIRTSRVAVNAFLVGLALSLVGLWMNETVLPPAGKRFHYLETQIKAELKGKILEEAADQKAFIVQDFEGGRLARLVAARRFEPSEPPRPALMREVTYIQYDKGRPSVLIQAERAEWVGPDKVKPGMQQWDFINATSQLMADVADGQRWYIPSDKLSVSLRKNPEQMKREQRDADQMTYAELGEYIKDLKRGPSKVKPKIIREFEVEKEQKLAIPFAALVFAMIAAPLGIRRQRTTAGVGIGLSLVIIVGYYVAMSSFSVFGQSGQVEPWIAAWGANGLGLLLGLILTWKKA
jgi:lipopolysaccharide export system permease protein